MPNHPEENVYAKVLEWCEVLHADPVHVLRVVRTRADQARAEEIAR